MRFAVNAIVVPVEASLMAILAITLIYASIRLLRRRVDVMSILFLVVAVVFFIATVPTPFPALTPVQDLVAQGMGMFSKGGARGLLIGIALGTVLTGLRILFGVEAVGLGRDALRRTWDVPLDATVLFCPRRLVTRTLRCPFNPTF